MYVVYLKDFEDHKTLISVTDEAQCALLLCETLNHKCRNALSAIDKDEILYFAERNNLKISMNMISSVSLYGSHFTYEQVNKHHYFDYSMLTSDWEDASFDAFSSDHYDYCNTQYWLDWHDDFEFDYDYGVTDFVDTKHVNSHKLKQFASGTNQYRKYDPKFSHQDVIYKLAYLDPLSTFAHNHGFGIGVNHIQRIINSIKVCESVKSVVDRIKGNIKYKKSYPFRKYANWVIKAMQSTHAPKHEWYLGKDFEIVDGVIWRKSKMLRYLGYGYKMINYKTFVNTKFKNVVSYEYVEVE